MAPGDSINVKMFTVKLASDDITAQQSGEYYTSQYFLMKARDRVRDRIDTFKKVLNCDKDGNFCCEWRLYREDPPEDEGAVNSQQQKQIDVH